MMRSVLRLCALMKRNDANRFTPVRLANSVVAAVFAVALGQAMVAAKPNIVFVLADDMGFGDVQALNARSKVSTPNLNDV